MKFEITLEDLLQKILGSLDTHNEAEHDFDVYNNLNNYDDALTYIVEELEYLSETKDARYLSTRNCGNKAYKILTDLKEKLDEIIKDKV